MNRRNAVVVAGVVAVALTALWPVMAQDKGKKADKLKDVATAMTNNKMTLSSAVKAVEDQTKGVAVSAKAAMNGADPMIAVEVVVGEELKHMQVDKAGKITDAAEMLKEHKAEAKEPKKKP